MKLFPLLLFLLSCTAQEVQMADDFIQGEAATAEKVLHDASGIPEK